MGPALAIIKKNLLSIICGLVAVAAIIALFWPISGYFAELQTQVDARKAAFTTATTLLHKQRTLPVLDPLNTDPQPLKVFPTPTVIARGTTAAAALAAESKDIFKAATTLIVHRPLIEGALPNGGTMDASNFLRKYQQLMVYPPSDPELLQSTLPVTLLHAGVPPTPAEITARQDEERATITQQKTLRDSNGNPINGPQVEALVASAVQTVPDEMRSDVATKNQMYMNLDAYRVNTQLTGVTPPSTVTMFNGQAALWLLQDVFTALASANDGTTGGIPGSRIKHLIKVDYADDFFAPKYSGDAPAPSDPLHPDVKLNMSPTGHVSNGLYDVVPFGLRLIVDAAQLPEVLTAISKNRFITILRMDISTVDSGQAATAGFLYGDQPVVQLNLSCEELFFRTDTSPFMPDSIRKGLGIAAPAAAQ